MAEAFIPEKLYVTLKKEHKDAENLLGFMSPFGTDKAFKKRQENQLTWAYQSLYPQTAFNRIQWYAKNRNYHGDQLLVIKSGEGEPEFYEWVEDETLPKLELNQHDVGEGKDRFVNSCKIQLVDPNHNLRPRIIDNTPQVGFQFTKSVRRTYWGGGNVVWRVLDPRGFELEISSANLARIMDCSCIKEGVIEEPCVWGRSGAQNILLPLSSDIYKEAEISTRVLHNPETKISLKDINIGDTVKIANDKREYEYLSKFTIFEASNQVEYGIGSKTIRGITFGTNPSEKYVFRAVDTGALKFVSTPKIIEVVRKIDTPRVKTEVVEELNEIFSAKVIAGSSYDVRVVGCCIGKLKGKINKFYGSITTQQLNERVANGQSAFCSKDGTTYMTIQRKNSLAMEVIEVVIFDNEIKFKYPNSAYFFNDNLKFMQLKEFEDCFWCSMVLEFNEFKVPVDFKELNKIGY